MMLPCLVCDGFIEGDHAYAYFEHYPICSDDCVIEWNALDWESQRRYIQCLIHLYALRE